MIQTAQPLPFIGRENEINEITDMLMQPTCRLLTLVGPGGSGKTRLAVEVVNRLRDNFEDGAYIAYLQALYEVDMLPLALVDAVGMSLGGASTPKAQLQRFLKDRELLLVLDNFDHLMAGVTLIPEMLEMSDSLKILVTSREVLNLQNEWLFTVEGMPVPETETVNVDDLPRYSAIQLFAERAQRVRHDFSLDGTLKAVVRICRYIQGMPLGVELAAAWTRILSVDEIASEIQRTLDFLETNLRDFPERHRSMRAVFEQSWENLTDKEREVFRRLSVFRGGFRREAAQSVADTSLLTLSSLVDKSLLQHDADGRYTIHELLRQFANEKLAENPDEMEEVVNRQAQYYIDYLARHTEFLYGGYQVEFADEVATEMENIRHAMRRGLLLPDHQKVRKAVFGMAEAMHYNSLYSEAVDTFEDAKKLFADVDPDSEIAQVYAEMLYNLGYMYIRFGRLADAWRVTRESQDIFQRQNMVRIPGVGSNPTEVLALIKLIEGDYDEAADMLKTHLSLPEEPDNYGVLAMSNYLMSSILLAQGDYEAASLHAQRSTRFCKKLGDEWFMAYSLIEQGNAARALGDYLGAQQCYKESYDLRAVFNDPEGVAHALTNLGQVAILQDNIAQAIDMLRRAIREYEGLGDRGGLSTALESMGNAMRHNQSYPEARDYLLRALDVAVEVDIQPRILSVLSSVGALLIETGASDNGVKLLRIALHHPLSEQETRDRTRDRLQRYNVADQAQTPPQDDDPLSAALRARVMMQEVDVNAPGVVMTNKIHAANVQRLETGEFLLDPLSDRELEVLHLLAQGLTNQQIADELVVALGTVKAHNHNIFSKLGVKNRVRAIARATELGLL